jgi:DNA adenine methylase
MYTSPSFVSPLRYPGGKGRLGAWLRDLIVANQLGSGTYVEPYAGGAGAAMYLLLNNVVEKIMINDADPMIYSFWHSIKYEHKNLIELIKDTPVNMETWSECREFVSTKKCEDDLLKLGFSTFFLNRVSRSGIVNGGVIGGLDQKGKYKIDARYNKRQLVERIENIAEKRDRIAVACMDAMDFIDEFSGEVCEKSLVYFDPPYYQKGGQLYRNYYRPEDHVKIARRVREIKTPWLVTYDNCREIVDLYSGVNSVEFQLNYSTHKARPKGEEIMFYNGVSLPGDPYMKR